MLNVDPLTRRYLDAMHAFSTAHNHACTMQRDTAGTPDEATWADLAHRNHEAMHQAATLANPGILARYPVIKT
jgi:hypothetical protein